MNSRRRIANALVILAAAIGASMWNAPARAQNKPAQPDPHAQHQKQKPSSDAAPDGAGLGDQIAKLSAKVAELEAALQQRHQSMAPGAQGKPMPMSPGGGRMSPPMGPMGAGSQGGPAMGGMNMPPSSQGAGMSGQGGGMGMMDDDMMMGGGAGGSGMGGMGGGGGMGMMQMMQQMEAMEMMGMMGSMGGQGSMGGTMAMSSAFPGFPGASHIYHIGATGFFLDHPQHIALSLEQQTALNGIKQQSVMEQADFDRKIEQAEQELWELTASDQPDSKLIEAKVGEIGGFNSQKRIAFIRAVGEAAKVLTDDQRKALLGQAPPQGAAAPPQAMSDM